MWTKERTACLVVCASTTSSASARSSLLWTEGLDVLYAEAGASGCRKVTGNLKLVHEMYGPKNPLIPHEAFKREFADAIASNEEIDKHFNKARCPCATGGDDSCQGAKCECAECFAGARLYYQVSRGRSKFKA